MWVMYDDVDVDLIPASAQAVLGYVDGRYVTKTAVESRWPKAHKVFLTVNGSSDADGIDCEPGDASDATVVRWVRNKLAAEPTSRPVVYKSVSGIAALVRELAAAGIPREKVRLLTAHYTGAPHICGPGCWPQDPPPECDGTQWTDKALGRSLDESLLVSNFFDPPVPPKPPKPKDPHHYLWFDDKHRVVAGFHLVERNAVKNYDRERRHPLKNRRSLTIHKAHCRAAADRIAHLVIAESKRTGKPRDWKPYRRGWRYAQLIKRAHGKRVVK